jgi:hypothetical protein
MPSAPYHLSISAARAGALFASPLQRGDEPSARQVRQAIATAIGEHGAQCCAARVAQAYGEHPETALTRMRGLPGRDRQPAPRHGLLGVGVELRLGPVQIDDRDPEIGAHHLAQFRRGLGQHDLQRREHPSLQEVTPARRPVRQPEHDVHVQAGTVLTLGDITDQRQHLALFANRDAAVLLRRPVEPADGRALKGADGGDLRSFQALGARELRQGGDRLIARVAHHHVGDDVRVLDNFRMWRSHTTVMLDSCRNRGPRRQARTSTTTAVSARLSPQPLPIRT